MENDNLTRNDAMTTEKIKPKKPIGEFLINNSLYIFMIIAMNTIKSAKSLV